MSATAMTSQSIRERAFAQIPAADHRDINRRGVLQEDRVRGGRHAGGEDEEHDRERVADGAADLCQ